MDSPISSVRNKICEVWDHLSPLCFDIFFVRDSKTTFIETDSDLQAILCLSYFKKEKFLVLFVKLKKLSQNNVGCSSISCSSSKSIAIEDCVSSAYDGVNSLEFSSDKEIAFNELMKKGSNLEFFTGVGQKFQSASDFRKTIIAYCAKNGFKPKFLKNCKELITVQCAVEGCSFKIHASCKFKQLDHFLVRKFESTHSCGGGFRSINSPLIKSDLVKTLILDEIRDEPTRKTSDIIASFKRNYDINLSYYYAYMGKKMALKEIFGNEEQSYNDLVWYLKAIERSNSGSHTSLVVDGNTNQFEKVYISYEACIYGFYHCRPMIFLDATFLKGRNGCLMAATAKNGNQGMLYSFTNYKLILSDSDSGNSFIFIIDCLVYAVVTQFL